MFVLLNFHCIVTTCSVLVHLMVVVHWVDAVLIVTVHIDVVEPPSQFAFVAALQLLVYVYTSVMVSGSCSLCSLVWW